MRGRYCVEPVEGHGLGVVVALRVRHLAVPQRVVGDYEASLAKSWQHSVKIFRIAPLVCVDIDEVPFFIYLRDYFFRVAYMEAYPVAGALENSSVSSSAISSSTSIVCTVPSGASPSARQRAE